jgi:hypothetical protein
MTVEDKLTPYTVGDAVKGTCEYESWEKKEKEKNDLPRSRLLVEELKPVEMQAAVVIALAQITDPPVARLLRVLFDPTLLESLAFEEDGRSEDPAIGTAAFDRRDELAVAICEGERDSGRERRREERKTHLRPCTVSLPSCPSERALSRAASMKPFSSML